MRPICSHCGTKGHNSGTCMTGGGGGGGGDGDGERGIMLFGVRVTPSSSFTRRSISMTNLTQLNGGRAAVRHSNNPDDGYFSDVPRNRRPRRGKPWTEEEHRRFLRGLHALGKGEWRGISRYYVKTRTSTQVASHAQKYFLRLNCISNRRRRGPSLFDITTDSIAQENSSMEPMKIQIIETDMIGLTATLPISGESSRRPSSGSSMLIPPTLRMVNLSIDDETAAPELFLSLAMPSSPSSSDESSFD